MMLNKNSFLHLSGRIKYRTLPGGHKTLVWPNGSRTWAQMTQYWNFLGFLYHTRAEAFFNVLWNHKKSTRGHDLLMAGGPLIIPFLLDKINDKKPYSSIMACKYISNMGTYARKSASTLLLGTLKKSKNYIVRGAIIRTLGEIKAENAIPEIGKIAAQSKNKLVKINAQQVLMLFKKITIQDVKDAIKKKYGRRR